MLRRVMLALVATATAAGLLATPMATAAPTAASTATTAAVPSLDWADCGDGFQCATARVPLDYDHPRGATISLALIRLPAGDPARKIGSIFINPGGPGGSGVDFVRALGPFLYSDEVRARFDLVGFDPRGIIRSTPLRCFETFDQALAVLAPMAFPVTRQEERGWVRADRALARACARRGGAILDHMATADVARDLDLLRRAVGDDKLSYVGYSYGTYLGATYANLFPNKVRALVVDGVLDPIAWATGRGDQARTLPFSTRLRSDQGALATLNEFFRLGTFPFTYADLVATALGAMYDAASWPFLADFLQQLWDLAQPDAAAATLRALRARLGGFQQEDYPNFVEGFPGVACSETDNPANVSAWARAARASDRRFRYFGRLWTWITSICQPWPGHRYDGPWTRRTSNPVLVVGNHFDPATRYQGAVILDNLLPRSRLLTLAGWGHTSLFASACIDGHVSGYLLTTRVPPQGTVCQPDVVPFAQPATQAQTLAAGGASARAAVIPPMIRRLVHA